MAQKRFEFMLSAHGLALTPIYYWMTVPSSNLMISELKEDNELINAYSNMIYFLIVVCLFWSFFVIYKPIDRILTGFFSILMVIPMKLIEKNVVLLHHLQRVRKGGPLY